MPGPSSGPGFFALPKRIVILNGGEAGVRDLTNAGIFDTVGGNVFGARSTVDPVN